MPATKKPKLDLSWRDDLPVLDLPYMLLADKDKWHWLQVDFEMQPEIQEVELPSKTIVPQLMVTGRWGKDDAYTEVYIPFWALKPFNDFIEDNLEELNNTGKLTMQWKVEQDSDDKNSIEFRTY